MDEAVDGQLWKCDLSRPALRTDHVVAVKMSSCYVLMCSLHSPWRCCMFHSCGLTVE